MAREEHEDLEGGDVEKELDKVSPSTSSERSSERSPNEAGAALTKEPDVPAVGAPCANSEDVLSIAGRGRRSSDNSSHHTTSDGEHEETGARSHRTRSRAQSSARSVRPEAVAIPRGERWGFCGRFTLIPEVTEPYDYSNKTKWMITFIVALAGAAAPMGSSIVLPALTDIRRTFNTGATVVNLSVAMYMLSMSIFPLWWSSFSETLGRRMIYITSFALFFVFNVLAAESTSIGMFVVTRLLSGGAAASVQAVGAGTIADVWEVKERGRAMGIFYLGPLCGPLLSPIVGGALAQGLGWRSAQWFLAIFGACILVFVFFCLPETLRRRKNVAAQAEAEAEAQAMQDEADTEGKDGTIRPTLTRTTTMKSVHVKSRKYLAILRRVFVDPLRIILYLRFTAVAMCVFYASVTFGSLYMLNISLQASFEKAPYNYGSLIIGCLYLPNSCGYFVSSIFGGRWIDSIMAREARKAGRYDEKGKLKYIPEDRMKENAWIGCFLYPAALLWYGWTTRYGVNVAAPMVANFFFGVGSMLIFALVTTMLTEFMPRKASHGIALNNFVRNIFSCIGTIVAEPLIDAIGDGWLFTGIFVIATASGILTIWAMKKYGNKWRIDMDEKMEKAMGD